MSWLHNQLVSKKVERNNCFNKFQVKSVLSVLIDCAVMQSENIPAFDKVPGAVWDRFGSLYPFLSVSTAFHKLSCFDDRLKHKQDFESESLFFHMGRTQSYPVTYSYAGRANKLSTCKLLL